MGTFTQTIVRTARIFDGVTPETVTGWSRPPSQGFLRSFKGDLPESVGSFTTQDLGAPDRERPMAVWFRLVGVPDPSTSRLELRSAREGDTDEAYQPVGTLLEVHALKTTWQGPLVVGPTDRVCPVHSEAGSSTMEFRAIELTRAIEMGLITDLTSKADDKGDCCITSSITVTGSTTLTPWNNTLIVFVNGPAGTTIQLPPLADVALKRRAVFARVGGGVAYVGTNLATAGDKLNGVPDTAFEVDGYRAVTVDRREQTWISSVPSLSKSPLPNEGLVNDTLDGVVDCPDPNGHVFAVRLSFTKRGVVRLPPSANIPVGDELYFTRFTGTSLVTFAPRGAETLDGVINGRAYLPRTGTMRFRKTLHGLTSVGGQVKTAVQTVAAGNVVIEPWAGHLLIRLVEAANQTCELPDIAKMPPGATCRIVAIGGTKTIQTDVGGGTFCGKGTAFAATVVLAEGECGDFEVGAPGEWLVV